MRLRSLTLTSAAILLAAGCGPGGPPNLEGFGDIGDETEGDPTTVGDGDGDPGDGDGDGDPNDECIDIEFGSQPEVYFDSFLEPELPSDHAGVCGPNPGPDFSIAWTAPQDSVYRAELFSEFPAYLTILRGGCDGPLENCNAFDFPLTVDFVAEAGQDYTFVVDSEDPNFFGYFEFRLFPTGGSGSCPVGELVGTQDSASGSTSDAGYDYGSDCGGWDAPDHPYVFTPPVTGVYRIDTLGSNYDTMLHVFEGYCQDSFLIDCNDDNFDLQSEVTVYLEQGVPYTIVVDGFGNDAGSYNLNLELIDGNDNLCDGAEDIGSQVPQTIEWEAGIPSADVFHGCGFPSPFERRFIWTAPASGDYRLSQSSETFSSLALVNSCEGDNFACGQFGPNPWLNFEASQGQSFVFVSEWEPVDPGLPITLEIEALGNGGPGCGQMLPPGVPSFAMGSTLGSGNNYSGSCSSGPAPEVEYWWTAPASGSYRISLEGSNYDTLMYVRNGGCGGPELGCNDDTFNDMGVDLWSTIELDLNQGQTISIFVDGYNGSGSYDLAITQL